MKRGFTLIELLCCIFMISLLSLIAVPSFSSINNKIKQTNFEKTSQELLKDLRYSRIRAMTSGAVKVHFFDDGYWLYDYNDSSQVVFKRVKYPDGIKFIRYKSTIPLDRELRFKETGTISPYACSIVIEDSTGAQCTISIKVTTFTIDFKR